MIVASGIIAAASNDEYGLLWQDNTWIALSPIEVRLVEAFLQPGHGYLAEFNALP